MIIICFLICLAFLSLVLALLTQSNGVKNKQFQIAIITFFVSVPLLIGFCVARPYIAASTSSGLEKSTEMVEISQTVSIGDEYVVVMIPNEDGITYTAKKLPLHNVTFAFEGDQYLLCTTKYSISSFRRLVWDIGRDDTYRLIMPESRNPHTKSNK